MMGDGALIISREAQVQDTGGRLRSVAGLYAEWLGNEGRDPTQWLALARGRARKALEGNDSIAIRNAVRFLPREWSWKGHDDAPEQTMR